MLGRVRQRLREDVMRRSPRPCGTATHNRLIAGRERGRDIPRSLGRMVADPREWVP
jgi:hypothetical protein